MPRPNIWEVPAGSPPVRLYFSDRESDYLLAIIEGRYLRLCEPNGAPHAVIPCPAVTAGVKPEDLDG